nr:fumarate hydratase [Thermanaerovibrio velox]
MRLISSRDLSDLVKSLALRANFELPSDVRSRLEGALQEERCSLAKAALSDIVANFKMAEEDRLPICQDCGLAVVFVDWGQEAVLEGASLQEAVDLGIREAYAEGYLRKSVVYDPIYDRRNSMDNTPAVVHLTMVPGDRVEVVVAPKGMGSENMSRIGMLKPADGEAGVIDFIVSTVSQAGPNPCPPVVVGAAVGGNFEQAALGAKRALLRPMGQRNRDPRYARLEEECLHRINRLGIGAGGYGGVITALDVRIEQLPTHIAGMPVAVNLCCHALRHAKGVI